MRSARPGCRCRSAPWRSASSACRCRSPCRRGRGVALSLPVAMAALAEDMPGADPLALAEHYRGHFVAQREAGEGVAPLYPGAREALARLAADPTILLGVATGKARRGLDHLLAAHPLE